MQLVSDCKPHLRPIHEVPGKSRAQPRRRNHTPSTEHEAVRGGTELPLLSDHERKRPPALTILPSDFNSTRPKTRQD
ncbi:hypothetical protein N657DRAFT_641351 [Parathielavia appendiculata]|uniref:Uncharacterized protein n=1 Tax=Parathielavia appendiculata TaxID=2587402 RepID=A0AAN6U6I3_9PEZI|nr:hypothetical protein N657DRAFT_641351 [Parathielavia appendiculata]